MSERVAAWLYVGDSYLPDVPARDLTTDEYESHRTLIEANYAATGRRLYVPLAEMDEQTARLQALLDSIGTAPRLTFGEKLEAPVHPAEVMVDAEDEGLPDFDRTLTESE